MIAFVSALLTGISSLYGLAELVKQLAGAVTSWYIQQQARDGLASLNDSIAQLAGAKTDDDRYAAIASLQKTLGRTRIING